MNMCYQSYFLFGVWCAFSLSRLSRTFIKLLTLWSQHYFWRFGLFYLILVIINLLAYFANTDQCNGHSSYIYMCLKIYLWTLESCYRKNSTSKIGLYWIICNYFLYRDTKKNIIWSKKVNLFTINNNCGTDLSAFLVHVHQVLYESDQNDISILKKNSKVEPRYRVHITGC